MSSETKETGSFTDSRDGKTYKTVKIGNQTWMAKNLAYKSRSGCWAYDNDESNVAKFGYLYDWETAKSACPSGWHLPSKDEWLILMNYLGGIKFAGYELKSTNEWEEGNNSSGFSALPGGFRKQSDGIYYDIGSQGLWWTATEYDASNVWACIMDNYNGVTVNYGSKQLGSASARYIKDDVINANNKDIENTNKEIPFTFTDNRDGKIYKKIKIGTQTWMAENLAYKTSIGCWAYDNDERNVITYGYLYDWESAKKACPLGWHLPNNNELQTLFDYLGGNDVAGGKLKFTTGWNRPNIGASNSSGFSALPGGDRFNNKFLSLGDYCNLWTATEDGSTIAWFLNLYYDNQVAYIASIYKNVGFSVRCIKDDLSNINNTIIEDTNKEIYNTFTDIRDGKTYKTVNISTQIWMAENLAYKANSGCWAYDNDESNVATYGYLYDWETAKKVCPKGWHLPSDNEWQTIIDYLGGEDIAGNKLKSTSEWKSPNKGATNSSGFSALPGGGHGLNDGLFFGLGDDGFWWSVTEGGVIEAFGCYLCYVGPEAILNIGPKQGGFSVRCIKDNL